MPKVNCAIDSLFVIGIHKLSSSIQSGQGSSPSLSDLIISVKKTLPMVSDTAGRLNLSQLKSFLGPAFKGLILQTSRGAASTTMKTAHDVHFDWTYDRENTSMTKLYNAALSSQWNAIDLDWSAEVDPLSISRPIIPDAYCPGIVLPQWALLSDKEKAQHRQALLSWMLSQILHGEQGALYGACQVVQAVPWLDGKLFGSTQVLDEGRHVEVFHRYLSEKLGRKYEINENLYVLSEFLVNDSRWDVKFLGMQIMIEGFGLGAFTMIQNIVDEPLLKNLLKLIIADEARHVHYGMLALQNFYRTELSEKELREREDLAFEISLLLQRRFLAHEIYDEYWGNYLSLKQWDKFVQESQLMRIFRKSMFRLVIPHLKKLGLLSARIQPRYRELGLLDYLDGKTVYEMSEQELLGPVGS